MILLGRTRERALLVELLESGRQVVGVNGRAGVGKSALLASLAVSPPAGLDVWRVDLDGMADAAALCTAVARRLGISALSPIGDPVRAVERLADVIGHSAVVLALDHLPDRPLDLTDIDALMAACPNLRVVLVTSQPIAGVTETVAVQPLDVPPSGTASADALGFPSVQLFMDRAMRTDARFRVDERTIQAVAEICRLVGGLPLGIELAAARVRMLTPERLATELRDGPAALSVLSGRGGAAAAGVREALASTLDALSDGDRRLLGRLSVFTGPLPFSSAVAVGEESPARTADRIEQLADLRLLEPGPPAAAEPTFWMLPAVRRFVGERGVDDAAEASRRNLLERVLAEADLAVARAERSPAVIDAHTLRRDLVDEATRRFAEDPRGAAWWLTACAALLVGSAEAVVIGEMLEQLIQARIVDALPVDERARVWLWSSNALAFSPDGSAMADLIRERWQRGSALADEEAYPLLALQARSIAATNGVTTGDLLAAVEAAREGRRIALAHAQPTWAARFEVLDAAAIHATGDVATAVALALEALRHAERVADLQATVGATIVLRTVPVGSLPADAEIPAPEDLLAAARAANDAVQEWFLLGALTRIELTEGRPGSAARWCAERLTAAAQRGWSYLTAISVVHTILISAALGDFAFAARMLGAVSADRQRVLRAMAPATSAQLEGVRALLHGRLGAAHAAALTAGGAVLTLADASSEAVRWLRPHETAVVAPAAPDGGAATLTTRERDVLALIAEGMRNREIGEHLGVSVKTVMHHSVAIYRKLAVRGRAEATAYAHRHGLIADPALGRTAEGSHRVAGGK